MLIYTPNRCHACTRWLYGSGTMNIACISHARNECCVHETNLSLRPQLRIVETTDWSHLCKFIQKSLFIFVCPGAHFRATPDVRWRPFCSSSWPERNLLPLKGYCVSVESPKISRDLCCPSYITVTVRENANVFKFSYIIGLNTVETDRPEVMLNTRLLWLYDHTCAGTALTISA